MSKDPTVRGKIAEPIPQPQHNKATPLAILITGASRGLGLELATQYAAENPNNLIIAAVRNVKAEGIVKLAEANRNVKIIELDSDDDTSIKRAAEEAAKLTQHLDVLINNAGIDGERKNALECSRENLMKVLNTNVAGPMLVSQAFLPLLRKGKTLGAAGVPPRIFMMSSGLGSISSAAAYKTPGVAGFGVSYPTSKAALNMVTMQLALDLQGEGILVFAVGPGWIRTDMGSQQAPNDPKDACLALRSLIESRTMEHHGGFWNNVSHGGKIEY